MVNIMICFQFAKICAKIQLILQICKKKRNFFMNVHFFRNTKQKTVNYFLERDRVSLGYLQGNIREWYRSGNGNCGCRLRRIGEGVNRNETEMKL